MNILAISIVPADGLAPLGARPSADTVMTKSGSGSLTFERLNDSGPVTGHVSVMAWVGGRYGQDLYGN